MKCCLRGDWKFSAEKIAGAGRKNFGNFYFILTGLPGSSRKNAERSANSFLLG
jgi:hypothetical protein